MNHSFVKEIITSPAHDGCFANFVKVLPLLAVEVCLFYRSPFEWQDRGRSTTLASRQTGLECSPGCDGSVGIMVESP